MTDTTTTGGSSSGGSSDIALSYSGLGISGPIEASVSLDPSGSGGLNLKFAQGVELPQGKIDYALGATLSGGEPIFVGSVAYTQALPAGQLSLGVRRDIGTTSLGESRLTSGAWAGLSYKVTPISSFSVRIDYLEASETLLSGATTETEIKARYSRALTPDWDLSAGVSYRISEEEGVGTATSPSVSLGLSRTFLLKY